jgi:hypothetical protein
MTSARELSSRLHDLLGREQSALADFLLALADFDANRRWQELGYTSLFHYLHRELGMSKGAAHYRKTAAELVRRVPEVVEPLREGLLCMLWNDRSTAPNVRSFRPDQAALETAQFDG